MNKKIIKSQSSEGFLLLLKEVKNRIQQAQARAVLAVNAELIRLYWDVGRTIDHRQEKEGWGTQVIPRLAKELSGELAELKGFSTRNLERMVTLYRAYPHMAIPPQTVAELADDENTAIFLSIPWGHHILLMEKIKDQKLRFWYMGQTLKNGWSRNILSEMIKSMAHERQGKAISNFERVLPAP